jgi:hypothetical protein
VETDGVLGDVSTSLGVVVAEAVVVEAGFSILVLALVAERTILGPAIALVHGPVAVECHFPRRGALRVVQTQRGTQVVAHYALYQPIGRELGERGKAVFLEEPGEHLASAARPGPHFQFRPLVQRLVAVPHPLRHLAPEALADPAPQRIVAERDGVAVRPRYFGQLPCPVPGVVLLLPIGQGLPRQVAFRIVLVAHAPGPLQLPAGTVGTVRARRCAKQVAHHIGLAHVLAPIRIRGAGQAAPAS